MVNSMITTNIYGKPQVETTNIIEIAVKGDNHFVTTTSYSFGRTEICLYDMSLEDIQKMINELEDCQKEIIEAMDAKIEKEFSEGK